MRRYIHLFDRQRTDDQVREAMQSAMVLQRMKMPDSDGDTLGLATLRTAVSVGQPHSLMQEGDRQDASLAFSAPSDNLLVT